MDERADQAARQDRKDQKECRLKVVKVMKSQPTLSTSDNRGKGNTKRHRQERGKGVKRRKQ